MPEDELDPGASTQMFQAFMDRPAPEESRPAWVGPAVLLAAVGGLVIVLVLAFLLLRG